MSQLERLKAALDEALFKPNPLVPITLHINMGDAAATAYSYGARFRRNRFGCVNIYDDKKGLGRFCWTGIR